MKPVRKLDEFEILEDQSAEGEVLPGTEQQTRTVEVRRREEAAQVIKLPVKPPGLPSDARNSIASDFDDAPTNPQIDFEFKAALEAARRESAAAGGLPFPGSQKPDEAPVVAKSAAEHIQDELDKEEVTVEVTKERLQGAAKHWKARAPQFKFDFTKLKFDFTRRTMILMGAGLFTFVAVGTGFLFLGNDDPKPVVRSPKFPPREVASTPPTNIQAPSESMPAAQLTAPPAGLKTDLGGSGPAVDRAPAVTATPRKMVSRPNAIVIPPSRKPATPAKKFSAPKPVTKTVPSKKTSATKKKADLTSKAKATTKGRKLASVAPSPKKKAVVKSKPGSKSSKKR